MYFSNCGKLRGKQLLGRGCWGDLRSSTVSRTRVFSFAPSPFLLLKIWLCPVLSSQEGQAEDREDSGGVCQPSSYSLFYIIHTPCSCLLHPVNMNNRGLFSFLFTPRYLGESVIINLQSSPFFCKHKESKFQLNIFIIL